MKYNKIEIICNILSIVIDAIDMNEWDLKLKKKKNTGPVWYMCLKTENRCLKTFIKICVGEKLCWNTWNII